MRDARRDLLVAARAAVGLGRRVARNGPDEPVAVRGGLDSLDAASSSKVVERHQLVIAAVMTTRAHIRMVVRRLR
jgi:hypothetical protein